MRGLRPDSQTCPIQAAGRYLDSDNFRHAGRFSCYLLDLARWIADQLQVIDQVPENVHSNVHQSSIAFAQAMIAIGIDHVVKGLTQSNQAIDQAFDDLNVSVRFTRTSHDQQFTLESFCKIDWC